MFYLVRTHKFLIFIMFLMELNMYNLAIRNNEQILWVKIIFYICIVITLMLFITSFKFKIEKEQLTYEFTLFGVTCFTKHILVNNIKRIEMKKVPDNRIAIYLKKGMGFVVNDFKMKHIDDELADFAIRNDIHFKDTRPAYLKKQQKK